MGGSKKKGKERLDKFYHLAKDQGYRSRACFKLIQLAKKFDFLSKSKICLDLCAAPGGWAQVAQRNMPSGSQIIALDLAPIKPIQGVTCIQSDITTEKCRQILKKEMRDKADCVLHDGAPNVGASWAKDAYGQNELTLHALKLACEHLKPGGTFVTKVFRSADYNSLLWVFNQLFHKVDATKPTASRNVSAEIFVMCIQFKAGKIDPKFFDPKWVFMENLDPNDGGESKKPGDALTDLFKNKAKRSRGGYNPGDDHRILPAHEFIACEKPAEFLISAHKLSFDEEESKELAENPLTTEEVREISIDLKVVGKRDLAALLKWRVKILQARERAVREAQKAKERVSIAIKPKSAASMIGFKEAKAKSAKSAKEGIEQDVDDAIADFLDGDEKPEEDDEEGDSDEDSEEADAKITEELDDLVEKRRKEERIDAKKTAARQKKQEWRKKLSLGVSSNNQDEPELLRASNKLSLQALEEQDDYIDPAEGMMKLDESSAEEESESEDEGSDEELDRYAKLEVDLAVAHALKKATDGEKYRNQMQRGMKKKKETRRERVMAAWAGELSAFNEALDQRAYHQHLVDSKIDDNESGDDDDDDDDEIADLKALRNQQSGEGLFAQIESDALEASMAGPDLSEAARGILRDKLANQPEEDDEDRLAVADDDDEEQGVFALANPTEDQLREQHRAKRWFSQDIFKNVGSSKALIPLDRDSSAEEEEDGIMREADDRDLPKLPLTDKEKRKLKRKKEQETLERLGKKPKKADLTPMEVAPLEAPKPLVMTGPQKPTDPRELAETLALGSILINSKKDRMDLIDASYNRWTFDGDEALPDWFTEDENKHNKPELPITKEMMAQFKAKMREINERPIRKVAQAKARKKRRLMKRLDRLRKTAVGLADTPDMSEAAKARMIRKQVSKMASMDKRKLTTVAIKKGGGGNRGKKEKGKVPKGAKLKVVDKRLKNDARSEKRSLKKNGAKGKARLRKNSLRRQNSKIKGGSRKNSGGKNVNGSGNAFGAA